MVDGQGAGTGHQPLDRPILVVDDDAQIRQVLQLALEDQGWKTVALADGRAAVAWLAQQRPAVLLLDISLPGVDGTDVADQVRARHGSVVPIVVLTADERAAEKAQRVGAVAYFRKPFELHQLIACLQRVVSR